MLTDTHLNTVTGIKTAIQHLGLHGRTIYSMVSIHFRIRIVIAHLGLARGIEGRSKYDRKQIWDLILQSESILLALISLTTLNDHCWVISSCLGRSTTCEYISVDACMHSVAVVVVAAVAVALVVVVVT